MLGHPVECREFDRARDVCRPARRRRSLSSHGSVGDSSSVSTSASDTVSTVGQCTVVGTRSEPNLSVMSATITPARLAPLASKGKGRSRKTALHDLHDRSSARRPYLSCGSARQRPSFPPRARRHRVAPPAGVRGRGRGAQLRSRRRAALRLAAGPEPADSRPRAARRVRAATALDPQRRADARRRSSARPRAPAAPRRR